MAEVTARHFWPISPPSTHFRLPPPSMSATSTLTCNILSHARTVGVSSKPTILRTDKTTRLFSLLKRWTIPYIALWEDHFYISPPHVPNPPKTGALVEVVRDNIYPQNWYTVYYCFRYCTWDILRVIFIAYMRLCAWRYWIWQNVLDKTYLFQQINPWNEW